jgi:heterotetrameric sarcosine oxidase gamma subunit
MSYHAEFKIIDDLGLINLRGASSAVSAFETAIGTALPNTAHTAMHRDDYSILCLAPDQWWLRCSIADEERYFQLLRDASQAEHAAVTLVSDHFTGFSLIGDDARQVLRQGMSMDLGQYGDGQCTRGGFARCGATMHVIKKDFHYDLFVESSYTDYVSLWLKTAIDPS